MKSKLKKIHHLFVILPYYILRSSIADTIKQDGVEHAGYLAFLSLLSLFPFLIFLFSLITYFGSSELCTNLIYNFLSTLPANISISLLPRINEIVSGPPQGLLTIAIIGIIWTASSAVDGLKNILNRAYRAPNPPPYVLARLISIVQFIMIALIISATLVVLVLAPVALHKAEMIFLINFKINYDWLYFRQTFVFGVLFITISLLYHHLTDVKQKYIDTIPGTLIAILLWTVTFKLFSIYLINFNQFNLVYGSLGGIIGILMFCFLVNLILIIGAEFNYHFRRAYNKNSHRRATKKVQKS